MVRSCHTDKGIMSCQSNGELVTDLVKVGATMLV